jgi:hypothetical protein
MVTITMINPCESTTLETPVTMDLSATVGGQTVTSSLLISNTVASAKSNPLFCGALSYSLSDTTPTFVTISGDDLVVVPLQATDVGFSSFTVTIALADYSTVSTIQTINLTVIYLVCTVVSMSPVAIPAKTYTIGDPPLTFSFNFGENPVCPGTVYSLDPSPAFLTIDQTFKTITISSSNLLDVSSSSYSLIATPTDG